MKVTRVHYTVEADFEAQNKKNIEAVMSELRGLNNADVKYATYTLADDNEGRKEDGKTFMHLVHYQSPSAEHLPTSLESFKHFQTQLKPHLQAPPKVETIELVDSSFAHF